MKSDFYHRTDCRACGSSELVKFLDFGVMPLANSFLNERELKEAEKKFPLAVYFCEKCALVQLLDVVNPDLLFKNYLYMTSASRPLVEHFNDFADIVVKRFIESDKDLVVEIGSNDGALLQNIKDKCEVLGIEPAENLASIAESKGVKTLRNFFSKSLAGKIIEEKSHAKVVIANNVMAHIDNLHDVFDGVRSLIGNKGVFIFEVHWVGNLIGEGGFDQIYHEHLCYYSLHALKNLVELMGMKIFDINLVQMHGQSLRVFVATNREVSPSVDELISKEKLLGLTEVKTFHEFSERVEKNKQDLISLLSHLKSQGKKIMAYATPAKGNTLLNFCGIDGNTIDYAIDTTSFKQGLYTPGSHIQIFPPEKFQEDRSDYALLLAWNYADAILKKEEQARIEGVKFIIPVPEVKVI